MDNRLQKHVLVVYPWLPHYRYGVFHSMEQSRDFVYHFASDLQSEGGIATIPPALLGSHIPLRNLRLRRGIWQRGLMGHLLRHRYDAVIFLGDASTLSTWTGTIFARLKGATTYFWTIGWHRPEAGLKKLLRMSFYRLSNHLLIYGEVGRKIGVELGFDPSRMTVVYNSHESHAEATGSVPRIVDDTFLADLRRPVIGAVIRLTPAKSLPLLIEAAGLLREKNIDVTVLLGGEGPMRDELVAAAETAKVDLRLLGAVYHPDDLSAIYSKLLLTVVPSTAGLTTVQSMSYGVPVVTDNDIYSQAPESEAIIPGVTGDTYNKGDARDLADKIGQWLAKSDEERIEISAACKREVQERWNPESQSQIIERVLRDGFKDNGIRK